MLTFLIFIHYSLFAVNSHSLSNFRFVTVTFLSNFREILAITLFSYCWVVPSLFKLTVPQSNRHVSIALNLATNASAVCLIQIMSFLHIVSEHKLLAW
jgi:hypothetical protein